MTITVRNYTVYGIDVSINQWGDSGSAKPVTMQPAHIETWDRTDPRGFVMYVDGIYVAPYLVFANNTYTIAPHGVLDSHGNLLTPINQRFK
ncbi:hypothetical protein AB1286_24430 [Trinickia sp. NRRL B-1857]|uniref:hypothetical protein n=1 Tax=Trinickia sp. NRRL B-1857 TaxID=3162879 RepID=UPI003D2C27AA